MFRRRVKRSAAHTLKDVVTLRISIRRTLGYIGYRALRIPGTPENIARGLAAGVAISFTPFLGLHTPLAVFLAWLIRGNMIASALSSAIGNPLTFYFIFWFVYHLGVIILGKSLEKESFSVFISYAIGNPVELITKNFALYFDHFIFPILIGFIPAGLFFGLLTYSIGLHAVRRYQTVRRTRIQIAAAKRRNAATNEDNTLV
ncbi:MAG: DUF2062 domain-containing protein [Holosporales bacterium]|jgi:uncharacterized protein (DUF2062 family)